MLFAHISKIGGGKRINKVEDVLELGQTVDVVVEDIDPNGKVSLRMAGDAATEQVQQRAERSVAPQLKLCR